MPTTACPTIAELIAAGEIAMVVNTPTGQSARADGYAIRAAANVADVTAHHDRPGALGSGPGHRGDRATASSPSSPSRSMPATSTSTAVGRGGGAVTGVAQVPAELVAVATPSAPTAT